MSAITRREFAGAAVLPFAGMLADGAPSRLPRRDSFFGLHFDLHPNVTDKALGRDVTDEMVDHLLASVRPDFVQYDCKGHVGYLGYPGSKVGPSAPGIVKDSLEIWRRVTARRGVALYIHFSGIWDYWAATHHPEWARRGPDGKPDLRQTSTFGPYVDDLMIPELKEAASRYDLDGAWVDGECWADTADYCDAAASALRERTGSSELPRKPADKGWLEFLDLNREQFRRYVKHYVDEMHRARPGFQIASNWLYSTFVPERPELPVDFLSGDYLGNASISTARLEARYLAATGKPWDLMAWGFQRGSQSTGPAHKTAVQLQQEACAVLTQGGGFQVYYNPTRAGRIDDRHVTVMSELARFCRERQSLCHKSESVPQVAVLFSKHSLYKTGNKLFGNWGKSADPARGILDALLAAHYSVDVLPDWKLADAQRYPVIVVPDWPDIGAEAHDGLASYANGGGSLVIVGADNGRLFQRELGVELTGEPATQQAWIPGQDLFGDLRGRWQDFTPGGARVIASRYPTYDSTRDARPAATVNSFGRGKAAGVFGPVGTVYAESHAPAIHEVLGNVIAQVFTPVVTVDAPSTIEVALRRKDGRLCVHLSNTTAMQVAEDYAVIDFVPRVGPIRIGIRLPASPKRVTWEPGGAAVAGEYSNGVYRASVRELHLHGAMIFNT